MEIDVDSVQKDVDISAEMERFNRWLSWKLSRSRLQANSMEEMHLEEDWVIARVVADYQLHELINADQLLELFKVGAASHKVGELEKMKGDHDDDDDDDDDMDDAPQGGHGDVQPDEQDRHDDDKAVEDSDDDIPLSKRFPTLATDAFQKKAVDYDVVEVENLEKEDEDVNTFRLEESTVCAYRDEEGNIIQLDQENLEALVDIILEDAADKLMDEIAQKVVDEDAAEKEKAELAQVAALAAQLDEEDARVEAEAAAAAKAKKTKTYSRKRKPAARKSSRAVKRKIILEEEEIDEVADEAVAEAALENPKNDDVGTSSRDLVDEVLDRQLVMYEGGLSTPLAEPIVD
ncbi:hypothetical protein Dimus_037918 [Dionaea muscipula]